MKKIFILMVLILFLVSFVNAEYICTETDGGLDYYTKGKVILTNKIGERTYNTTLNDRCFEKILSESYCTDNNHSSKINFNCPNSCKDGACIRTEKNLIPTQTKAKIKKIIQTKNKLKIHAKIGKICPIGCTCSGSVMKCKINRGKEMTIRAGKSGNTIVQIKGINMSTKVELYKDENKVYGVFKNNKTKEIKVLPDQVREKIKQKIKAKLQDEEIELNEAGVYKIQARKKAKLFFIFPVKEQVEMQMNSETGEMIRKRNSWWGFLARDIKE